jgi:hypothetical protein
VEDDEDAPTRETWASIVTAVLAVVVGGPLVDRYGWVDGLLRTVAIISFATLAVVVDWRPVFRNWRRTRDLPAHEWVPLFGTALAGGLYLFGTFVLGEPGPGGVVCIAALVLLGLTAIVTIGASRRASAST